MTQLPLFQHPKKKPPPPFVCVDPEGKGRPWNGVGRPPDYVRKHLRETGMYPVAPPAAAPADDIARLEQKIANLYEHLHEHLKLFNQHIRQTTKQLEAMQRRIDALEQVEPMRRAA